MRTRLISVIQCGQRRDEDLETRDLPILVRRGHMRLMTDPVLRPILIAGPTASGKSAIALDLARRWNGAIVNADSMQVYRELRLLTARPSVEEEAAVPHMLYGHVGAAEPYSVARWLGDVATALDRCRIEGLRPVIVGGTGLYFKALLEGLSPVPSIPEQIRSRWRLAAKERAEALHVELQRRDPVMAERLQPCDIQRITRALEVIDATGRSLSEWQQIAGTPLLKAETALRLVVSLPRPALQQRADARFDAMLAGGAIDEVRDLLRLGLVSDAPVMRALGVKQIAGMLAGTVSTEQAATQAKLETRQYIKRQQTWLNRHMIAWTKVHTIDNCQFDL